MKKHEEPNWLCQGGGFSASEMITNHLLEWNKETGNHPRKITFPKDLFDRCMAESADETVRQGQSILSIIGSFKIAGPRGWVMIEREDDG